MKDIYIKALVAGYVIFCGTVISAENRDTTDEMRARASDEVINSEGTNTKMNVRDRSDNAVLPEDQSNRKQYVERTAAIRKEIVASKTLSTTAKNAKIVTLDTGAVVLRGPVRSANEKAFIEDVAKKHSGDSPVYSHLEIVPSN